jgi:WD40 repeat protein
MKVVSGDLNGFIKHWDLRSSRSLRTKYIRHQMTAFSCHSKIPIFATGSNSSFVNIFTPFGERLQCISKHKTVDKSQQRIGQISALTFHPTKPLLAFGSIDKSASRKIKSSISLYGPIAKFDFR